jgi:hypothetical protein
LFTPDDYAAIAFSDDLWKSTTSTPPSKPEQGFKFYVGLEDNITKIEVIWEGYSDNGETNGIRVWDDTQSVAVVEGDIPSTEGVVILSLTSPAQIASAINAAGELYVAVFDNDPGSALYTEYVAVIVYYKVIDGYYVPDRFSGTCEEGGINFQACCCGQSRG